MLETQRWISMSVIDRCEFLHTFRLRRGRLGWAREDNLLVRIGGRQCQRSIYPQLTPPDRKKWRSWNFPPTCTFSSAYSSVPWLQRLLFVPHFQVHIDRSSVPSKRVPIQHIRELNADNGDHELTFCNFFNFLHKLTQLE